MKHITDLLDLIEEAEHAKRLAKRQCELVEAESACCDEVLIELGLGSDATVIVRKPGSNVIQFKRRR